MPDQYFVKFAEAKQVADLSQWTEAADYAAEKAAWYPDSWATGEYSGRRVAIPNIGVGFLTYYNVDMWKQLGLKDAPPQTLDELVQVAQAGTNGRHLGLRGRGHQQGVGLLLELPVLPQQRRRLLQPGYDRQRLQ